MSINPAAAASSSAASSSQSVSQPVSFALPEIQGNSIAGGKTKILFKLMRQKLQDFKNKAPEFDHTPFLKTIFTMMTVSKEEEQKGHDIIDKHIWKPLVSEQAKKQRVLQDFIAMRVQDPTGAIKMFNQESTKVNTKKQAVVLEHTSVRITKMLQNVLLTIYADHPMKPHFEDFDTLQIAVKKLIKPEVDALIQEFDKITPSLILDSFHNSEL